MKKTQAFDMETNIPDPTLRNLTEKNTRLNQPGPEWKKGEAFDTNTNRVPLMQTRCSSDSPSIYEHKACMCRCFDSFESSLRKHGVNFA